MFPQMTVHCTAVMLLHHQKHKVTKKTSELYRGDCKLMKPCSSSRHCGFIMHPAKSNVGSTYWLVHSNLDSCIECRYLCDEALDTEALREALSLRVDGAEEVKKEMREDIAEDKRKLKVSQASCTNWSGCLPQLAQHSIAQHSIVFCRGLCIIKTCLQTADLFK